MPRTVRAWSSQRATVWLTSMSAWWVENSTIPSKYLRYILLYVCVHVVYIVVHTCTQRNLRNIQCIVGIALLAFVRHACAIAYLEWQAAKIGVF